MVAIIEGVQGLCHQLKDKRPILLNCIADCHFGFHGCPSIDRQETGTRNLLIAETWDGIQQEQRYSDCDMVSIVATILPSKIVNIAVLGEPGNQQLPPVCPGPGRRPLCIALSVLTGSYFPGECTTHCQRTKEIPKLKTTAPKKQRQRTVQTVLLPLAIYAAKPTS